MSVTPQTKLADRADRVFFLNGGDNHASCTVKVINAATGRARYTNSVVWTTSPSGGRGQGGVASPPATAAPPTQQSISFEVVPPSPPAPALLPFQRPLSVHCRRRRPRPRLPLRPLHRPLPVHRRCRRRMHRRLSGLRRRRMHHHRVPPRRRSLERPQEDRRTHLNCLYKQRHPPIRLPRPPGLLLPWSPARHLVHRRRGHQRQHHGDGNTSKCSRPLAPAGYEPLTPHASRNLGRKGDRRIDGRTRSQDRAIG